VEQHPSVEADGRRAIQEIPHRLWDPKINYRKPNLGPYLESDTIQYTHTHTHTRLLLSSNIAFNVTVVFVPTWSLPAGFPKKIHAFTWRDRGKCENHPAREPVDRKSVV
jgi:hypothetical protein